MCEYFDTTKGKKISRDYVVQLQDKVRALNNELSQYTDEEADPYDGFVRGNVSGEGLLRPGEMVRLQDGGDETPRYLGPSSGIAMTRLLMEAAKRYTDSARISELFPDVRVRRNRIQSVVMGGTAVPPARRKSYPMVSEVAAEMLPNRQVVDRLVEVFNQRGQYCLLVCSSACLLACSVTDRICQHNCFGQLCTKKYWPKTSTTSTPMIPTRTRTLSRAWSSPSACKR